MDEWRSAPATVKIFHAGWRRWRIPHKAIRLEENKFSLNCL